MNDQEMRLLAVTSGLGSLYQSPLLSQLAMLVKNRAFIAEKVLRSVPVPKQTFQYLEWDRGGMFKAPSTRMTPNSLPNQLEVRGVKRSGSTNTEALAAYIDPKELEQAGGEVPLQAIKTQYLTGAIQLRKEIDVAAKLRDTTVMTANRTLAGNQQWSDYVNSDPRSDVSAAADGMHIKPNTLILGRPVATKLRTHPKILDVTKYTERGIVAWDALADYFEVEKIIVGEAFQDTAAPGQAESLSFIWGKDAILGYIPDGTPDPLMEQPALGYIPTQDSTANPAATGGSAVTPFRVFVGRDQTRGTGEGSTIVKVETDYGIILGGAAVAGYLFKNAVA